MKLDFKKNYETNVKQYVEKKGQFDYISWSYCQKLAKEIDPNFKWKMLKSESGSLNHDGFVLISMTFCDNEIEHYYPILNFQNKPIASPTSFDINNAQMRGLAKLFSMESGLGLSLFTGEDLAMYDKKATKETKTTPKANNDVKEEFKVLVKQYATKFEMLPNEVFAKFEITGASSESDISSAINSMKMDLE